MNLEHTLVPCVFRKPGVRSRGTQPTPRVATVASKAVLPVEGEAGPHLLVQATGRDREPNQRGLSGDPQQPFLSVTWGGTR